MTGRGCRLDIYLDTNLWNELCKQDINPTTLLASLGSKNARLILSNESVYELAKTFLESGEVGPRWGVKLFSYLRQYTSESIPITRDNMALLAAEMHALQCKRPCIFPFLNAQDYALTQTEIEKLSRGEFSERARNHINGRMTSWASTRSKIIEHIQRWPETERALKAVPSECLNDWLTIEMTSQRAIKYLAWQIRDYFPEAPVDEAEEYAQPLLASRVGRVAKALVRRNLYLNWRCANRRSVPKDLFCDSNHILNSSYCDVYATKDQEQIKYAGLFLPLATKIAVYARPMPIDEWFESLT
jgi:hypothetical protein